MLSMFSFKFRPEDSPARWYARGLAWLSNFPANFGKAINQLMHNHLSLRIIQVIVLGGILAAFVLPVFFSGE